MFDIEKTERMMALIYEMLCKIQFCLALLVVFTVLHIIVTFVKKEPSR